MALYRTGTASMDAQGVITGVDTKWREPLSLIRTGATIVFLTSPIKLAVINTIDSDTSMTAIGTDGNAAPLGQYVILLHDSLTVDGMAQDVAETLRYYQSKESEIGDALEFFRDFDLAGLQALVQQTQDNAAAAETSKNQAEQIKSDAQTIKEETQAIKDGAFVDINASKEQAIIEINNAKGDLNSYVDSAAGSATAAAQSKADAETAKAGAEAAEANAETAQSASETAKAGAEAARDEAEALVGSLDLELYMKKGANLSDIVDKAAAWLNVRPIGATPLAADPVNALDAATKGWSENLLKSFTDSSNWTVYNRDTATPGANTFVQGGKIISRYTGGTLDVRSEQMVTHNTSENGGTTRHSLLVVNKDGATKQFDFDSFGNFGMPGSVFARAFKVAIPNDENGSCVIRRDTIGGSTRFGGALEFRFNRVNHGYDLYPQVDADDSVHVFSRIMGGSNNVVATFAKHSNGSYTAYNGAFVNGSDVHVKRNIVRVSGAIEKMWLMKGCTWTYKANGEFGIGFIAQDVEKVFPGAVTEQAFEQEFDDGTSIKSIKVLNAGNVAAALHHEAILELVGIVEDMKSEMAEMKSEMAEMREQISTLSAK